MPVIRNHGTTVRMTAGDYGVTLPIRAREHCEQCVQNLADEDQLVFVVSRSGREYLREAKSWGEISSNEGDWEVLISREVSAAMTQGLYSYSIYLIREGEMVNTILGPADFEVI